MVIEPLLRAATPATFGVGTVKSCGNHAAAVRRAVALVDPTALRARSADLEALPTLWRERLDHVEAELPAQALSALAVLRRLALSAHREGRTPADLDRPFVAGFVDRELATRAENYAEKIRVAFRAWNAAADADRAAARLDPPAARSARQAALPWAAVPPAVRAPLDAVLERAISVRALGDWGSLVGGTDDEDAELGLGGLAPERDAPGALVLEAGTHRNWRAAVQRAWHAALVDPRVDPKPATPEELFDEAVAWAVVRGARRARCEARGEPFDPAQKGRYEHTLVEALCSVGRAVGVADERLARLAAIKRAIDPLIVGWRRNARGDLRAVYADRAIGPRHAGMLAQFNDTAALRRWFEAPGTLWRLACRPGRVDASRVALARSALLSQIGQRVAPLRRTSYARLRWPGEDRHLHLPAGDGHGWLVIPAHETKTYQQIKVRIDPETVALIKEYIARFLPVAQRAARAAPDNPHLFPGVGGREPAEGGYAPGLGHLTKEKLNTVFARHLRKHLQLRMCCHVMRHICGKIILDQDPCAMALVQVLLGHKSIETTRNYYAEVSGIIAQARYLDLLEQGMRQALAQHRFNLGAAPRSGRR